MSAVSYRKLKNRVSQHWVATYLVVDPFIECFKCVAQTLRLQLFVEQHLLELGDHSVEDGRRDLTWLNVRREGILDVGVSHLERLVHDVMFVRLHFLPFL